MKHTTTDNYYYRLDGHNYLISGVDKRPTKEQREDIDQQIRQSEQYKENHKKEKIYLETT